jgi:Spy/CpxP family protein refolding chaperone
MTARHRTAIVIAWIVALPLFVTAATAAAPASQRQPRQADEQNDPRLKAQALDTLYELNLTADQLKAVEKLAAPTKADPQPKLGRKLRNAVNDLCDALAKGDDEKIADLQDKVDELTDAANVDDAVVELSDTAKTKAADVTSLLTAAQLANFIAVYADDVQGPAELLIETMDDARGGGDDAEYKDLRSDTVDEVIALTKGVAAKDEKLADAVAAFLDRVHKLSDADYKARHTALEEEARKLVGPLDPVTVVRHWVEEEFATLLSNPQLADAIHARLPHAGEHGGRNNGGGDRAAQHVASRDGAISVMEEK